MDEGFNAYTVRGEGLLSEVEELVMNFIVTFNDKESVTAAKYVTYGEVMSITVALFLKVRRVTS